MFKQFIGPTACDKIKHNQYVMKTCKGREQLAALFACSALGRAVQSSLQGPFEHLFLLTFSAFITLAAAGPRPPLDCPQSAVFRITA